MRVAMMVTAALALLPLASAEAGQVPTKEEGVGMLGGTVAGALIGGPPGAMLGLLLGAFIGDRVETAASALEQAGRQQREIDALRARLASLERAEPPESGAVQLGNLARRLRADVFFRTGSAELEPAAAERLTELGALLAEFPGLAIELHGFADPRGADRFNLSLSEQRVAAVRAALERGGLIADRVQASAHGATLSTAPTGDLEAYAWERRVSISLAVEDPARLVHSTRTE